MTASRPARLLALAVVVAVLLVVSFIFMGSENESVNAVAGESSAPIGWRTIQHAGVRLDIPADWVRPDAADCDHRAGRPVYGSTFWAPPDFPACENREGEGVGFYGSATYDPFHGPGIRRAEANGSDASVWAGYVYAGEFAVHTSHRDRDLVRTVLGSVRETPADRAGSRRSVLVVEGGT